MDGDGRVRDLASVDVTALLADLSKGKPEAADQLIPVVYGELRRLASSYMRREREGHTLQATALVHEAYMKLVEQRSVNWQSRTHFFGIAALSAAGRVSAVHRLGDRLAAGLETSLSR